MDRLERRGMGIVAVDAKKITFLSVPEAGPLAVHSRLPVPEDGPVALAAELVGLLEPDEPAVGEMEEIAKTFSEAGVTSGFHDGAAWIFQLLSETPYAAETRQNMDTTRTMETSVSAFADALAKRLQE